MKKILYSLLLLPFLSFGQSMVQQGKAGTNVQWLNNVGFSGYTKLPVISGAPGPIPGTFLMGKAGLIAYDSVNHITYVNNGTTWVAVGAGGGGSYPAEKVGNVYYLSKMGAISDATLSTRTAGMHATVNTVIIKAAMDSATLHPNSTIVFDGAYTSRPFLIPSNTIIYAPNKNCGAILPADSDYLYPLISNVNGAASLRDTSHPVLDENITINGGTWTSDHPGTPIILYGVNYLRIENAILSTTGGAFALTFYQGSHVYISNTEVVSDRDGLHFNGKVTDVVLQHLIINSKDDGIAINADDVFEYLIANPDYLYYKTYAGGMTDFHIDDIHFAGGNYGIRMLSSKSIIDNIFVNNIHGYLTVYGINISNYTPAVNFVPGYSNGRVGTVVISNMHVNITTYNGGGENNSPIYIATSSKNIVLHNITIDSNTLAMPVFTISQATLTPIIIDRLTVDGFRSRDTSLASPRPFIFMSAAARIKNLILRNIYIDRSSAPYIFSPAISGYYATIDNILLDGYMQLNGAPFINTGSAAFGADPAGFINVGRVTANNIYMSNTGTSGFVKAEHVLPILTLSNFDGALTDSGSIAVKNGDAYRNTTIAPTATGFGSLPATLLSYYNFTEQSGSFTDKVGANNLTRGSGVTTGVGKFGSGISFSSTSQFATGPSSTSLTIPGTSGNGGMFCGWFKIDPSNTGTVRLMGKGSTSTNNLEYELLYNASTHQLIARTSSDGTAGTLSTLTWSYTADGNWYLIPIEILVNGYIIQYAATPTFTAGNPTYQGSGAFTVGGFIGQADEVFVTHNTVQTGPANAAFYNYSPYQPQVLSTPLEFANDTEAAAAGIPLGGEYRTGSAIKKRVL